MSAGCSEEGVKDVVSASRQADSQLKCRAQRLAGMLHKLHFPEEETELGLLRDVLEAQSSPAVALLVLFQEALDTRGIPVQERLRPVKVLLDAQLSQAHSQHQQQQVTQQEQQQQLFTSADLSTALLAAVALLPDWLEDTPKSPTLVAECIGQFMARGLLTFGLQDLADAVKTAGGPPEGWDAEDPPLLDGEQAAPMLLVAANCIKARSGEAVAMAAWTAAGIDLTSLLPSFASSPEDVQQLLQKYDAQYLVA